MPRPMRSYGALTVSRECHHKRPVSSPAHTPSDPSSASKVYNFQLLSRRHSARRLASHAARSPAQPSPSPPQRRNDRAGRRCVSDALIPSHSPVGTAAPARRRLWSLRFTGNDHRVGGTAARAVPVPVPVRSYMAQFPSLTRSYDPVVVSGWPVSSFDIYSQIPVQRRSTSIGRS